MVGGIKPGIKKKMDKAFMLLFNSPNRFAECQRDLIQIPSTKIIQATLPHEKTQST